MLRTAALVLAVGNGLLLAAHLGAFDRLTGAAQPPQREPERLQRQVHPERVGILSPQAASAALAAAAASAAQTPASGADAGPACLEAGPFGAADAPVAERTLRDAGLPAGSWLVHRSEDSGAFLVYMGRFADRDTLQRKIDEVRRLKLEPEEVRNAPELQPGLSLGRFDHKPAADAALAKMVQRGVRTARVVTLRQAQSQTLLRVPAADAAIRARLAGLRLPSGPGFVACSGDLPPASPAAAPSASAAVAAPAAPLAPATAASAPAPRPAPSASPAAAGAAPASGAAVRR